MELPLLGLFCCLIFLSPSFNSFISARFIEASASLSLVSCACNTQECRSQGTNRCMATNMCYVQYVPPTKRNRAGQRGRKDNYIRGCINRATPLLCENRPPSLLGQLQSEWPVLHCCSTDLCNKNVLPTAPLWMPTSTSLPTIHEEDEQLVESDITSRSGPDDRSPSGVIDEEGSLVISAAAGDTEVPLQVSHIPSQTELFSNIAISSNDQDQTRILSPNMPSSSSNDNSSKILYIGVPVAVLSVLVFLILLIAGVAVLRRAQYVSTEDLVQRPVKNFIQSPVTTNNSLHNSMKKKKFPAPLKVTSLQSQGHDHVSYISGSALDDHFPDLFNQHPYFSCQPNRPL